MIACGTICRVEVGARVYRGYEDKYFAADTVVTPCVKVVDYRLGAAHPCRIATANKTIGSVDEAVLNPWAPRYVEGALMRILCSRYIYREPSDAKPLRRVKETVCVRIGESVGSDHPYLIRDAYTGDPIGWVDEGAMTPWDQIFPVGVKVLFCGGEVCAAPNGAAPEILPCRDVEVIDCKPAKRPYLIRDMESGAQLGWVNENMLSVK